MTSSLKSTCWISQSFDTPGLRSPQAIQFTAQWDTGATQSIVRQNVIDECRLVIVGFDIVTGVGGEYRAPAYSANIALPGGIRIRDVRMTRGTRFDADILIGMDIITLGDFAVTNCDGVTKFSFHVPSQRHIDFVEEAGAAGSP